MSLQVVILALNRGYWLLYKKLIVQFSLFSGLVVTLVPSAEAYEGDWLSEAIRFSLEFSCRKADLQEISNFYIKDGEYDITYADDVTFGDGKWQVNFEPRRLYPDAASGEELELFSKINVFDPSG